MNERLTERQQIVLRFLVEEYVESGRAVGSRTLTERYPMGVSPATVRNEMAMLERLGYIEHPHTSAGGVPTDQGFRYYVERYAVRSQLPATDQLTIRHQFRQVEAQLEGWMQLAATVLSEIAGNLAIITSPRSRQARLRHFEALSLQERLALLIVVTQDSSVTQSMLHLEESITQTELRAVSDRLNSELANLDAVEAQLFVDDLDGLERLIGEHVLTALAAAESGERTEVRSEGFEYMVRQPEFAGDGDLRQIFGLMRGSRLLSILLPQLTEERGVQIFIGEENVHDILQPFGIVVASYGVDRRVTGLLGIVGPRRMPYERSISSVRYMADLMSDLMQDLYYDQLPGGESATR